NSPISGATNSTYVATVTGNYMVQVYNSCGYGITGPFNLPAGSLPSAVISTSSTTTFCSGGSAILNANSGNNLTYQWKRNGTPINGATAAFYVATISGTYTCTETNSCGSNTSNGIAINVLTSPALPGLISGPASVCKKQT